MRLNELRQAMRNAGHTPPNHGSELKRLHQYLGITPPGSGNPVDYTPHHLAAAITRARIQTLTGHDPHTSKLHNQAAHHLTTHPTGYTWISENQTGWQPTPPLQHLRAGATIWPN